MALNGKKKPHFYKKSFFWEKELSYVFTHGVCLFVCNAKILSVFLLAEVKFCIITSKQQSIKINQVSRHGYWNTQKVLF
jgi:hypothetical protein